MDSRTKALIAARAVLEKHAEGVVVMDLRALSTVTDFFVVCTAGSTPQINALREHIEASLHQQGAAVWHTEGTPATVAPRAFPSDFQWVLMDCGDIVVHLLDQQARAFYQLEQLWADAPRVSVLEEGAQPAQPTAARVEGRPTRIRGAP